MKLSFSFTVMLMVATLAFSSVTNAGGVGLSATRIIYNETSKQASLPITNTDTHERYLVQAWVEDSAGKKTSDFVVTPPLFAASTKSENTLRIVYLGKALPRDREVIYWMNVKAIPSVNPDSIKDKNTLQLAILSRIKLFMRPQGLGMAESDAMNHLQFRHVGDHLIVSNPTPYYQTIVNLMVGGQKLPNTMVEPQGSLTLSLASNAAGAVQFQVVNDYGALSPQQIKNLK